VRELLGPHEARREILVEVHLGDPLAPVVVSRLDHRALHDADGARLDVVHGRAGHEGTFSAFSFSAFSFFSFAFFARDAAARCATSVRAPSRRASAVYWVR